MTIVEERLKFLETLRLDKGNHAEADKAMCVMEGAIAKLRRLTEPALSGCWLYVGYRQPNGYGWVNYRGLKVAAHRLALIAEGVDVPADRDVCHRCDVRACVNPAHLYVGTRRENMADCTERSRHNKPVGEAHWQAKLTDADVDAIRTRRARGETVTALAAEFGVHHATISRVARGVWR